MLRILLVTSDREECGIQEYSAMLKEAVLKLGLASFWERNESPDWICHEIADNPTRYDLVHLNHHAALHAAWKPEHIAHIQALGPRVVVTQHDTFEKFSIMLERGFPDFRGADALVVHEPVEGLVINQDDGNWGENIYYLRQGIPPYVPPTSPRSSGPWAATFGFPYPWKNIEMICMATRDAGWGLLIIAPGATVEQAQRWRSINENIEVIPHFLPRNEVISLLAGCTATIFHNAGGNSGTTGPIRLGIAARNPVISTSSAVNRQIRDLDAPGPRDAICWADRQDLMVEELKKLESPAHHLAKQIAVALLADMDSWDRLAKNYANIYYMVLGRQEVTW